MIMVHLVTGFAGENHITSADDGALNQAIIGRGCFILEGNQDDWGFFGAEIIDNNTVRIHCGEASMCGRHVRIDPGTFDDVKIDNGQAGMQRYDVICMTYEKDTTTGIESAYLEVIKGTPKASYPQLPSYENGDIYNGATKCRFMLYEVFIDGVELKSITKRAKTQCSLESLDRFVGDSEYMKVEGIIDSNTVTQAIGDLGNYVHHLNSNLNAILNAKTIVGSDTNPATLEPGSYILAGTSYNTEYFPSSNLWGILNVFGSAAGYKTFLVICSSYSCTGFHDVYTSDRVQWKQLS